MRSGWTVAIVLAVAAMLAGALACGAGWIGHGWSARDQPSLVETLLAGKLRRAGIPRGAKALHNPEPSTAENIAEGRNHWADHCAACHANNGSGETDMGRNLYPKAPDMRRAETQGLSDGELYSIIRNGVRMTGMPAWGRPELGDSDAESWKLVCFIRHLPRLTADEEHLMEEFNPKSSAERDEEKQEEEFLNGKIKEGFHGRSP